MRLPEDFEEQNTGKPVVYMFAGVCTFIVLLFTVMLILNMEPKKTPDKITEDKTSVVENDTPNNESKSDLVSDDLDFWGMYPKDDESDDSDEEDEEEIKEDDQKDEDDPSTDGKHTKIVYADGTEEWVLINQQLPKNTYDYTKLVSQSGVMKYYVDGTKTSYFGLDISKTQGYIEYNKLAKSGVDFVMLRVGARGYSTGQLVLDEYYVDNIKGATDAKLHVGLYFSSQATTKEEAVEEANMVITQMGAYKIDYPIVFEMETIVNDGSRTSVLTKEERTDIAIAFLDTIRAAGYIPMIHGDKEWLLTKMDMSKLTSYDIWLSQEGDLPDYPYQFSMWQYNKSGTVDGIIG
ncbi:MAG: glycoside hydrolase family 25 protein, partial [Lachnospiraceae bacterium]|nr:glycoside hydrolase family 25 protein [Lachnospiraceae bacterium]